MFLIENLKNLRILCKIPVRDMADYLSMSINNYHKIERKEVELNIKNITKIASLFNVKIDDLVNKDIFQIINEYQLNNDAFISGVLNRIR